MSKVTSEKVVRAALTICILAILMCVTAIALSFAITFIEGMFLNL